MTNDSIKGTWLYTFKDKKMHWSEGMFKIFRPTKKVELDLKGIQRLIHPLDNFKWELAINQASIDGPPSTFDSLVILENGLSIWVRHTISAYIKDGMPEGLQGICSDVTDLKISELESKVETFFK